MCNGVQEAVLLLTAADFTDKKNCVEHQAGNDQAEENDAQDQWHNIAPVMHQPDDVEINGQSHQARAQCDKECDCPGAASDAHVG